MNREDFYEKYKDVKFVFDSYYKYTFTFVGEHAGESVRVEVGGNHNDIYRMEVDEGCVETIHSLQPYSGICGEDSFYDY